MKTPVEVVLVGAGNRGQGTFGAYALDRPHRMKIVGVAEPDAIKRERFAAAHSIQPENVFETWEDLMARPQLAPALINCHDGPGALRFDARRAGFRLRRSYGEADGGLGRGMCKDRPGRRETRARSCSSVTKCAMRRSSASCTACFIAAKWVTSSMSSTPSTWGSGTSCIRSFAGRGAIPTSLRPRCCRSVATTLDLLVWVLGARCTKSGVIWRTAAVRP